MNTIAKATNLHNNNINFVSLIYNSFLAANIIVYTPIQGTNKEKYLNHIIYKAKMPTLAGNKHISVHFFFHRPSLFHLSTEKITGPICQKWTPNKNVSTSEFTFIILLLYMNHCKLNVG